jgi:hypothetical protein
MEGRFISRFLSQRLRAGFRWYDGIPPDPVEHESLYFVEMRGCF